MLHEKVISKTIETLKDTDSNFLETYQKCTGAPDYSNVIPELKEEYKKEHKKYGSFIEELIHFKDENGDKKLEYGITIQVGETGCYWNEDYANQVYKDLISQMNKDGESVSFEEAKQKVQDSYTQEQNTYQILIDNIDKFKIVDGKIINPEESVLEDLGKTNVIKLQKDLAAKTEDTCKPEFGNETLEKAMIVQIDKANENCYSKALAAYQDEASVITPCGAIAGIYCATDNSKGVWQAPANVSIASVSDVTEMISDREQEDMNVDTSAGKSVNAIRFFTGKGILVWGARTLDGNSKEWCYVSVRRLFNYIEESVQKSTAWAVFQPNDSSTWMKIQCQIENFLTSLWREGALAGATPDKAFFVNVGLGVTMTADDIYNGNLIVEIGLAAVRPAEFIILQFSHKVQE